MHEESMHAGALTFLLLVAAAHAADGDWIVWARGAAQPHGGHADALGAAGWNLGAHRPHMGDGHVMLVRAASESAGLSEDDAHRSLREAVRGAFGLRAAQVLVSKDYRVHTHARQSRSALVGGAGLVATDSWALTRDTERSLNLDGLFDVSTPDGAGATVYIVDTGVAPDTEFSSRLTWGYDAYQSPPLQDDPNGHGTFCCGAAVGSVHGISRSASVVSVRVLDSTGSGSLSDVMAGLDYVYGQAKGVVSMSLGTSSYSATFDATVQQLLAANFIVVAAAGNSATSACNNYPGGFPGVIAVAAMDDTDTFAWFSNYGSCVSLMAPGVNVISTWPGDTLNTLSGTSMATPQVAGVVANLLSASPSTTPSQALAWLEAWATVNAISSVPSGTPNLLLFSPDAVSLSTTPAPAPAPPAPPPALIGASAGIPLEALPAALLISLLALLR